jgi:hypothetical protein
MHDALVASVGAVPDAFWSLSAERGVFADEACDLIRSLETCLPRFEERVAGSATCFVLLQVFGSILDGLKRVRDACGDGVIVFD